MIMPKFAINEVVYIPEDRLVGVIDKLLPAPEYFLYQVKPKSDDIMNEFVDGLPVYRPDQMYLVGGNGKVVAEHFNVEPFGEMATIYNEDEPNLKIQVNPSNTKRGVPYFKVFDSRSPKRNETRIARLHFLDQGMEFHKDAFKQWIPNGKEIKIIKEVLDMPYDDTYTNWDMAKWMWNLEYSEFFNDKTLKRSDIGTYFNGKFDNDKDFYMHPSYVPSTTSMPETWHR